MHTNTCKHVNMTMTADITAHTTAITITVTSKTLKETSWACTSMFFFSFFFSFFYYYTNDIFLRYEHTTANFNNERQRGNKRDDEEIAQETSYDVSWTCSMLFLFVIFFTVLIIFF